MPATDNILALEKEGVSARIYLEPLTGLRGVAAAWVALWHLWGFSGRPQYHFAIGQFQLDLTPLIRTGWAGVDIFFVLSGFVLGLAYCQAWLGNRPPIKTGEYFRRRLLRVLPALWVQVAVLVMLLLVAGTHLPPIADLLSQALLLHNLLGSQEHQLNPVYWTLPVEFDFYLLLPLLALLVPPRRWPWLLLLGLAAVAGYRYGLYHSLLTQAPTPEKVWWLNQLPGRVDQFLAGMTAAWIYSSVRQQGFHGSPVYRFRGLLLALGILGFGLLAWYIHRIQPIGATNVAGLTYWGGHWSLFLWHSLSGLCIAAIVLAAALGTRISNVLLANPVLLFLGIVSYSLYLWHFPIIKWLSRQHLPAIVDGYPFFNIVAWSVLPVLLVSALSYWLVERPFLKIRHHSAGEA